MSDAPKQAHPAVNAWSPDYLDAQYNAFKQDPSSVSEDLQQFFQGFDLALQTSGSGSSSPASSTEGLASQANLMRAYRELGHLCSNIDPFDRARERPEQLSHTFHGLSDADLNAPFTRPIAGEQRNDITLKDAVEIMERTYCASIGIETGHVSSFEERNWLRNYVEECQSDAKLSKGEKSHTLYHLYRAELFERFCGKRYPGVKRFSLEGGESLIPMLDQIIERSADEYDVQEVTCAMSHRGRLNVLINIMGKTYEQVFTEFEDAWSQDAADGGGDVKYHRGYSSNRVLPSGKNVWLAMASNPSHLEAVDPVILGRTRAKQRMRGDKQRNKVVPIIMHGDAAFIGQGVVAETFNLSKLEGYTVGGAIHIAVNNLIGFTTGQDDARSTRYCSDMAKLIEAPVLHVNGEDPEAVVLAARIAIDYRMKFNKDIVIDMLCYRRHGHNESDEAAFTQPLLYAEIKKKPSVVNTYADRLKNEGVLSQQDVDKIHADLEGDLDRAYTAARKTPVDPTPDPGHRRWTGVGNAWTFEPVDTGVSKDELLDIGHALNRWPEDFEPHRKLKRILKQREDAVTGNQPFDWATAEALAIGSLLLEGRIVRFSGQDVRRGTFSHRHAVLRDVNNASTYTPLNNVRELGVPGTDQDVGTIDDNGKLRQNRFCIYDSPLSEFAVLGFEYGFSLASPDILAIWEAQFGDFMNGAQVIIDQFLASAELKWQRWTALTLLLPHGYEGQGPEHSSARLERFLTLCGQNNMQVVAPTTPSQYFHLLRRQLVRPFRKPLVVMSPKSLLRLPECTSITDDCTTGHFHEILDDPMFTTQPGAETQGPAVEANKSNPDKSKVTRILFCQGKVYYDLIKRREQTGRTDLAILRVEQLYPLHTDLLKQLRDSYPASAELVWVQEEPKNTGAALFIRMEIQESLGWEIGYAGRDAAGTPATGSPSKHNQQLDEFLTDAIGPIRNDEADSKDAATSAA